ncbi:MAG: amidohydrolase family protein [Actinomycetota bacterium]|nr:amidohydrolase family protein [Actinomycetota bacterium]
MAQSTERQFDGPTEESHRRIDTHVHVYRIEDHADLRPLRNASVGIPEQSAPVEWLIEDLHEHKIAAAVLVQHSALGADNSYLIECVDRFPGTFRAIGLVEPFDPAIAEAMGAWARAGVMGFRFHLFYPGMVHWLESDEARRAFGAASDLGVILQFHMVPENAAPLAAMLERYPDVRVVIDHLAKPDVAEPSPYPRFAPVLRLAEHEACIIKIGDYEKASALAYPWVDTWPFVELLRRNFTAERMIWGTGFPGAHRKVPLDKALAYVEYDLPLSARERDAILWETPRRWFGLD